MGRLLAIEKLVVGTAGAVAQNATEYSEVMVFSQSTGEVAVLLVTTAGSITVSQQCSTNNKDWYDPVDATGAAVGVVTTAEGVTTGKWIVYTPVMSEYIRFKVVENNTAATTVTIKIIVQEAHRG